MSPIEIEFDMLVRAIQEKNNPLMMQYFNTLIIDHPVYEWMNELFNVELGKIHKTFWQLAQTKLWSHEISCQKK